MITLIYFRLKQKWREYIQIYCAHLYLIREYRLEGNGPIHFLVYVEFIKISRGKKYYEYGNILSDG